MAEKDFWVEIRSKDFGCKRWDVGAGKFDTDSSTLLAIDKVNDVFPAKLFEGEIVKEDKIVCIGAVSVEILLVGNSERVKFVVMGESQNKFGFTNTGRTIKEKCFRGGSTVTAF